MNERIRALALLGAYKIEGYSRQGSPGVRDRRAFRGDKIIRRPENPTVLERLLGAYLTGTARRVVRRDGRS